MAEIDIKDTRLFVTDTGGDLPPVVFLHGFLFDGRQFDAQIAALSDHYRCVTIDFPGQGRSGRSTVGYGTENLSALMVLALQQLDLGPVDLVGLSMGGFTAMRIAVRRPDLLKSLTLVNSSAAPHDRAKIPKQLALAGVARVAGLGLPPVLDGAEEEMYGEAFRANPDSVQLRDLWRRRWSSGDRTALVNTLMSMMKREDFRPYLPAITVPTSIIAGSADVSLPPEHSQQMQGLITGSSYVELPGVGHSSPIEDPVQVTAALERFLSRN